MDWIKESDWILWRTITVDDLPDAPTNFRKNKRQVNQNDIAPNICTITSSFWCVADVTGYEPTDADILEVRSRWLNHPTHPFDPNVWWYVHLSVDEVRKYCDEVWIELSTLWFLIWSREHEIALEKWYSVTTWHSANRQYNIDRDDDWIVSVWWIHNPVTYWHSNRQSRKENESRLMKVDSYFPRKTNIYELANQEEMLEAWRQFKRWFIFFPKYIMDTKDLPIHVLRDQVTDADDRDIIIAWETELSIAMKKWVKPIYSNYQWKNAITRMIFELGMLRS